MAGSQLRACPFSAYSVFYASLGLPCSMPLLLHLHYASPSPVYYTPYVPWCSPTTVAYHTLSSATPPCTLSLFGHTPICPHCLQPHPEALATPSVSFSHIHTLSLAKDRLFRSHLVSSHTLDHTSSIIHTMTVPGHTLAVLGHRALSLSTS